MCNREILGYDVVVKAPLICGLYYKPMTIVNDDARIITKLDASLTDDARVVINDYYMFIVQVTGSQYVLSMENNPMLTNSGLYYKHITIVNDDSSIINKYRVSLVDDTRVIIQVRLVCQDCQVSIDAYRIGPLWS